MATESRDGLLADLAPKREAFLVALGNLRRATAELGRVESEPHWRSSVAHLAQTLRSTQRALGVSSRSEVPETVDQRPLDARFEEGHGTFLRLLPHLIQDPRYQGRYVAIAEDKIVDDDSDEFVLAERVAQTLPNMNIFIGCVTDDVNEVVFSSPEFDDL